MEPAEVGDRLSALLFSEDLRALEEFTLELTLLLTRTLFMDQASRAEQIARAVEESLEQAGLFGRLHHGGDESQWLDPRQTYLIGRLVSTCVMVKHYMLMSRLERLRGEYLALPGAGVVLEVLQQLGPQSQRALAQALAARGEARASSESADLPALLSRLLRDEVLTQEKKGRTVVFRLSLDGLALMNTPPPWITDVEGALRAWQDRRRTPESPVVYHRLWELFDRLELGRVESPEGLAGSRPGDALGRLRWIDPATLPPSHARGLPRLVP